MVHLYLAQPYNQVAPLHLDVQLTNVVFAAIKLAKSVDTHSIVLVVPVLAPLLVLVLVYSTRLLYIFIRCYYCQGLDSTVVDGGNRDNIGAVVQHGHILSWAKVGQKEFFHPRFGKIRYILRVTSTIFYVSWTFGSRCDNVAVAAFETAFSIYYYRRIVLSDTNST